LRSAAEIAFRLRQEVTNVALMLLPPSFNGSPDTIALPHPEEVAAALRDTAFAGELVRLASEIRGGRVPLLGLDAEPGSDIRWRRDFVSGKETGLDYFRLIPYLDATRAGDHKNIWELNRHQHLVVLAQAFLFDGNVANLKEIYRQIESWEDANKFQRGINWASTLEVSFRALSWLWIYFLVGSEMPPGFRSRLLESLYRHGKHIENNLSFYFSPNTHLLGEAVALHALGFLSSDFRVLGAQVVAEQMDKQVREDGSHFEQSTYYHVYALDMFLFHAILAGDDAGPSYRAKLERMAEFLQAVQGPQRTLPLLGDDDGGRFFHPYGIRENFGRATLATCGVYFNRPEWIGATDDLYEQAAWWLGPGVLTTSPAAPHHRSQLFADSGLAAMTAGDTHIIVDAGQFGPWGSGHSHSDTLSIVVRRGDREMLVDAGTYTYVGDEKWRNWFRGSAAHNTIRIDGKDQATPAGPFRWTDQPTPRVHAWGSNEAEDYLDAECSYAGFTHRRRIRFSKPDMIYVVDEITGPAGTHEVEQWWHPASVEAERCLIFDHAPDRVEAWRSTVFGAKEPITALCVSKTGELPITFETQIRLIP